MACVSVPIQGISLNIRQWYSQRREGEQLKMQLVFEYTNTLKSSINCPDLMYRFTIVIYYIIIIQLKKKSGEWRRLSGLTVCWGSWKHDTYSGGREIKLQSPDSLGKMIL